MVPNESATTMFMKLIVLLALTTFSFTDGSPRRFIPNLTGRIVGGSDAPDGQYPYQVSLQVNGRHNCGASIINNDWIVTAAHCVAGRSVSELSAYVGSNKLSTRGVSYAVLQVYSHEEYDEVTIKNDVAILKVEPISFNDKVAPITLSTEDVGADEPCFISGWGLISFPEPIIPNNLQHLHLNTTSLEYCRDKTSSFVGADQICAISKEGEGVCSSDSGGPLARTINGVTTQIGIVSYSIPCGRGSPDVYARVSHYIEWFREKCNGCI